MDALLAQMPSAVFARWVAFHGLCPWGGDVDNLRAGTIAAVTANYAGRVLKEGARPRTAADFFPVPGQESPDEDDPLAALEAVRVAQEGDA